MTLRMQYVGDVTQHFQHGNWKALHPEADQDLESTGGPLGESEREVVVVEKHRTTI